MKKVLLRKRYEDICLLGGISTFVAGGLYSLMVICAFILPSSIATYQASVEYFNDFQEYEALFLILKWSMFLSSLAMLGVVFSIYNLTRERNKVLIGYFSLLAIIGYAFNLLQSILDMSQIPLMVEQYVASSSNIKFWSGPPPLT